MTATEIRMRCLECAVRLAADPRSFDGQPTRRGILMSIEAWTEAWVEYVANGEFHPQSDADKAATAALLSRGFWSDQEIYIGQQNSEAAA